MDGAPSCRLTVDDMEVTIPAAIAQAICAHAAAETPREACGLLLGAGNRIAEARRCSNLAADPLATFVLDPAARAAAEREARSAGRAVIGWYHSHPSGNPLPSAADAASVNSGGALWLIVAGGTMAAYHSRIGGSLHARFDPAALSIV